MVPCCSSFLVVARALGSRLRIPWSKAFAQGTPSKTDVALFDCSDSHTAVESSSDPCPTDVIPNRAFRCQLLMLPSNAALARQLSISSDIITYKLGVNIKHHPQVHQKRRASSNEGVLQRVKQSRTAGRLWLILTCPRLSCMRSNKLLTSRLRPARLRIHGSQMWTIITMRALLTTPPDNQSKRGRHRSRRT